MTTTPSQGRVAPLRYLIAFALYQAAWAVSMPLVWRYFRKRAARDPAYGEHLAERRGVFFGTPSDVWIHAVSLGEFRSAVPVIDALIAAGTSIVLTHATPAGRNASTTVLADAIENGQVKVCYAPLDRVSFWMRFFEAARPRVGLVFEMEFWPGMTEAAARGGVPMWFVNAQIPEKSFPRSKWVFRLLGAHPVTRAAGVFAKSTRMADRFRALSAAKVEVAGETRFDIAPPKTQVAAGVRLRGLVKGRPVFVFASVVEGEEQTYLEACKRLAEHHPRPLVIWVPRAPEVFESTFELLQHAGLRALRRSVDLREDFTLVSSTDDVDVILGDSFGEMFFYLAAADVVSVGGGFVDKGAHNVIEPLALGKPVIVGPHIWTIEFPGREARDAGVLRVCDDPLTLAAMLMDAKGASALAAEDFHQANLGASEKIVIFVKQELERTL